MPRVASTLAHLPPATLKWARESTGYSTREAADRLGVYRWQLEAAEHGDDLLTLRQAEKLAAFYGRPLAALFLPSPPHEEPQEAQFRRLPGAPEPPWPPEMVKLIRRVRQRQEAADEILDTLEEAPDWPHIAQWLSTFHPDRLASELRDRLGVSLEAQLGWNDPQGYSGLRAWVDAVEALGVLVMQHVGVPVDLMRGFAAVHARVPIIVVNSKDDPRARAFTVIHELGHLALAATGSRTGQETEAWCNEFAGNVLMPATALSDEFARTVGDNEHRIYQLALRFGVTPLAAATRVKRSGLLPEDAAEALIAAIRARPPRERSGGGNFYRNIVTWLGPSFVRLVLEGADSQAVTLSSAAGLLGTKVNQFQRLRETLDQRAEFG